MNPGEGAEEELPDWNPDRPAQEVVHALTVATTAAPAGLPIRFLQHGRLHDLYWLFLGSWQVLQEHGRGVLESWCPAGDRPSFVTFWRRWKTVWHRYLRFRKCSEHSQCQTCFDLQQLMHQGRASLTEKLNAANALRVHHQQQYLDRCISWSLRWFSRRHQGVLCIIIDSPDKTKFAWPRWSFSRTPKSLDPLIRPRIAITGAMAHGFCTNLFYADENQPHGANNFLECLMRTLVQVQQMCKERNMEFPAHLVIQSDNTVAQAKNHVTCMCLGVLVSKGFFKTITLNFMMVGHTHEDIDQLFGLLISHTLRLPGWQTPQEAMSAVAKSLRPAFQQRGETIHDAHLGSVQHFEAWLEPLGLKLHNAFRNRGGIEAPHSFCFKAAQDMTPSEARAAGEATGVFEAWGALTDPLDTMVCVKAYMRDTALQQAPFCMLPKGMCQGRLRHAAPSTFEEPHPFSAKEIETYLPLSHLCAEDFGMPAAAEALRRLATTRQLHIPRVRWLSSPAPQEVRPTAATGNPHFPHLPESSWRLLIKCKRGA